MANAGPGNIQCIDILTGKDLWENQRLGANHWGSMIYADGKLYATDQNGDTFILEAKPVFKQLGKNSLKEHTDATLAIADKELFVRTFQHLWCISNPK
jgi:outer membrane protein assembly factor BamB